MTKAPDDSPREEYAPSYGDLTELNRSRLILDAVGRELLAGIRGQPPEADRSQRNNGADSHGSSRQSHLSIAMSWTIRGSTRYSSDATRRSGVDSLARISS